MDFSNLLDATQSTLGDTLGGTLPGILGALLILVGGWLVAVLVRALMRRTLGLARLDERIESNTGRRIELEGGIAKAVYYVVLLLVLVAFFNALELERASGSLQALVDQVLAYVPKLVAGGLLVLVAWVAATLVRAVVTQALGATGLDERLSAHAGMQPMSQSLGQVLYWLIILLFLPAILGALGLTGLLEPVEGMVDEFLAMLPNVVAAVALGVIGWLVARILRDLVSNLLSVAGADRLGEQAGLRGTTTLSGLIGLVVYIFVLVPALIAALNALQVEAISAPATDMLAAFMAAIPHVFAAAVILAVAWLVAGFLAHLATGLLGGVGFDRLPEKLGLPPTVNAGETTPSEFAGKVVVLFVMLFAVVEAANRMGFGQVSGLVGMLIAFGAQVLLGVVILAVGFWIANLARDAILRVSGADARPMANLARLAIFGLVIAMGLRAMGLADDIVNLAFGLTLGSVAVAVALSFGLGGREAAGRQMEHWLAQLRGEQPGARGDRPSR